ncbi:hypothetical protein JXQ70_16130 [bacterium]|nr:hypothetical protein [bacterium]
MMTEQRHDQDFFKLDLIWYAMLSSLGLYLLAGLIVGANTESFVDPSVCSVVRPVLYLIALLTLFGLGSIRKLLMPVQPDQGNNQAAQQSGQQRYATVLIITLAIAESIGIYGLVLYLLGRNLVDLLLLLAVSAAVMYYYRPNLEDFQRLQ